MNESTNDRAEGMTDEVKGTVKEGWGKITGDEQIEAEGQLDQAKGKAKQGLADAKDAVDDAVDSLTD